MGSRFAFVRMTTQQVPEPAEQREATDLRWLTNAHDLPPCLARRRRMRPQGLKTANTKATVRAVGDTIGG
jgi:hypothetical protein